MEIKSELKETDMKNYTCHYLDDIINTNDIDLVNILWNEESYENILTYDITSVGAKVLSLIFNKADYILENMTEVDIYLSLFHSEKFCRIFNRIWCHIKLKSITSDKYSQMMI